MNHLVNEIVSIRFNDGNNWVTTLTEIFDDRVYVWDVLMNGIIHEGHSCVYLKQLKELPRRASIPQEEEYRKHTEVERITFEG